MRKKPKGLISGVKWHGSPDISWVDRCEPFDSKTSRNAASKYMFLSQRKETAEGYAGTSETCVEKAKMGLGPFPSPKAGVRGFELDRGSNVYHLTSLKKAESDFGVEVNDMRGFEKILDGMRDRGYDLVVNGLDADNVIVLNGKKVINIGCRKK